LNEPTETQTKVSLAMKALITCVKSTVLSLVLAAPLGCGNLQDYVHVSYPEGLDPQLGRWDLVRVAIIGRINEQQQELLQQQSPQTWGTIQHNDQVAAAAPGPDQSGNSASSGSADTSSGNTSSGNTAPSPADQPIPLSVDDVKGMASAGIKEDVICDEINESHASYSRQDIAAVEQLTPPVDSKVIDCMKEHLTS
jgi:hypothetical protein